MKGNSRVGASTFDPLKRHIKNSLALLFILIAILVQSLIYFSSYTPRVGYIDYDDAILVFSMAAIIFVVIIIFRRAIENKFVLNLLQLGWTIVIFVLVHTGLIQFVDLSYPREDGLLNVIIQQFQDNLTIVLGVGLVPILLGLYLWVSDIRSRERRFFSVISAMPVGVAVATVEGNTILCNDKMSEILGIQREAILNSSLWNLLKIDISKFMFHDKALSEVPAEFEIILEDQKKSKKYLTVVITAITVSDPMNYIVVLSDVTNRRLAEEEREQHRRVTALYSSLLTHDIGNDLQAVLGYIEGAQIVLDQDHDRAKSMLRSGRAAGNRMSNLIKTFRIESEKDIIEFVPMLRHVANEAELASMGLQVKLDIDPQTESLRCPGVWLLPKAFENIFRNSAQHAGETPEVHVRVTKENDIFVIYIRDNGPGIPVEIQKHLFHRSDPQRESGLGLYLTKQIITACRGTIELDKAKNERGAAFKITLPIID